MTNKGSIVALNYDMHDISSFRLGISPSREWPHVVTHDVSYSTEEWNAMEDWLNTHVGKHAWSWCQSDHIQFKDSHHALLFKLTWT